jgi:hypothetical protein
MQDQPASHSRAAGLTTRALSTYFIRNFYSPDLKYECRVTA